MQTICKSCFLPHHFQWWFPACGQHLWKTASEYTAPANSPVWYEACGVETFILWMLIFKLLKVYPTWSIKHGEKLLFFCSGVRSPLRTALLRVFTKACHSTVWLLKVVYLTQLPAFIKLFSTHSCVVFGFSVFHCCCIWAFIWDLFGFTVNFLCIWKCVRKKATGQAECGCVRDSASLFPSHFFTIAPHLKQLCIMCKIKMLQCIHTVQ